MFLCISWLFQIYEYHCKDRIKDHSRLIKMQPVFLCVDDTMLSTFDTKFENVSKLFDHATHNSSKQVYHL